MNLPYDYKSKEINSEANTLNTQTTHNLPKLVSQIGPTGTWARGSSFRIYITR